MKIEKNQGNWLSFLDKITIKNRLILLTSLSTFIVLVFALSIFGMNYYKTLYSERESLLYNTTKIMSDDIKYYVNQVKQGKLSEKEAKAKAIEVVNRTRFLDNKGYFFVYDMNGICITVPIKPELAGQDRSQTEDKKGFKYIQKIIELAQNNGGYLTYYFDKAGHDKSKTFPKLGYAEPIKEWNWVIGTGDYIDDIQNQVFSVVLNTIAICFAIFVVVVTILINTIGNGIVKPIEKITSISLQLAENNLNIDIEDDVNKTEIGDLNRSFKKFVTNLKSLIQDIYKSAEDLSASAEEMSASAEQISQGSQQTANGTNQLAQGAQEISVNIDQGAITINKMNKVIQEIYEEAKNISKLGDDTETNANKGSSHVQNAVGKIDNIKMVAEDISVTVAKLGKLSTEIETIVDLIKGIASQTNLLALNAAIEAARAGEHGKGFAVVADEVKKLAGQSAEATDQINKMIKEIQNETGLAVNKMTKATNEVDEGVTVVNEAGKALEHIIEHVKTANSKIQEITKQINGVANNSDDIVKMVENISAVTEETAASAQEISSITEEQTASMQEISASSQSLAYIAETLNRQVSNFKI